MGSIEGTQVAVGADSTRQINVSKRFIKNIYTRSVILAQVCLEQLGDLRTEDHLHFVGVGSGPNHAYLHAECLHYVFHRIVKLASLTPGGLQAVPAE